ncbi:MAG: BatA domain-containing protein [Candidatus Neomarinimicrobiota bacterium]|nr:BatA domain-containing protein [Candidatus Neomarinimicrobiota bacterium]
MTILSPSALWFFAAISIPIVIHLLSRLRINKVEFSTVRFIKQLETSSIRKMKFQQILLLLLRMLVIASLVMMMAQPVTQGFMPGWLAAEQDARLILVIDNSASMSVKVGNQSFIELSKKEALGLLPSFNKKTQITLAQTCPPKTIFIGQSNDPDLLASIRNIQPTVDYDDLWTNLNHLLKDETIVEPVKECVIFSDFMYRPDSTFKVGIPNFESWKFYFIQPGTVYDNLSIRSVSSLNRIKTMSQLVKLNTRIENSGELPKPNVPLELLFNEHRVGQVVSEIESGKEKEFQFQAYPANMGIVQCRVSLPKDNYDLDNNWFLSMSIMEQIRCGIIGANSDDVAMLEMVLRAIDPQRQFLSIESRIQPELNRLFLDDVDVALIHNPKNITEEGVKDLEKFLRSGGGVIWFQGNEDASEFHSDIFEKLGFPFPEKRMNAGQGFFSTQIAGQYSDLLQDLQLRNLDSELPEVFNYIQTKLDVKQKVHWILNNSDPLLIEFSKGSGSIFYFSTLLDLRWNDLAIRGMLVPLVYRLLVLTGTDEINTSSVKINEPKWISVEEKYLRHKWEIVSPSGITEMIVPEYDREGINISSTDELGVYTVYSNRELFTTFPTRLHDQEYIQTRFSQNDIESILPSNQTRWLTLKDEFSQVFLEMRQGKSLWKIFLALAILFLLAESIIGRPMKVNMKAEDS